MSNFNSDDDDYDLVDDQLDSEEQEVLADREGDESDPLASDGEPPPQPQQPVLPDEQDDPVDVDEEAIFGPSIDELVQESRAGRKRRRRRTTAGGPRPRPKQYDLPSSLKPAMGTANLAFVSKDYEKAEALILEIIGQAPRASQPYRTLGLILETRGDQDGALDAYMKAAEIEKGDRELWKRNASVWKEKGNAAKAIYCLNQALKGTNNGDAEVLRARAQLYAQDLRPAMAADNYVKLSRLDPFNVESAKLIIHYYLLANNIRRAADAIGEIVSVCERKIVGAPKHPPEQDISLIDLFEIFTELKLRQKRFVDANMLLARLRGQCAISNHTLTFKQRLMLAVCQHRLGSDVLAAPLFQEFMSSSTLMEKHRFLLWQVADACYDSGHYHTAADAYSSLIEMKDEEPIVDKHLRRAMCYKEINFREGAKSDLEAVLAIRPRHVVALLHIQEFLPKNDDKKRRKSIRFYPSTRITPVEKQEANDMIKAANDMFDSGDYEGYLLHVYASLDTALELRAPWRAKTVLKRHNDNQEDVDKTDYGDADSEFSDDGYENENPATRPRRRNRRWTGARRSPLDKGMRQRIGSTLMRTMDQEAYVNVVERVMLSFRAVGELELAHPVTRIFNSLSHLRLFGQEGMRRKLRNLDLVTSVADGSVWRGYDQARHLLHEGPTDADLLYVFTLVEHLCEAESDASELRNKSYRGLARLRQKHPSSTCLAFVMANISSRGGLNVQRYTVGFYLAALSLMPENALVCLCLAVQVLYVMMGRRIRNRNEVVPHAMMFMQSYERNRLKDVESGEEILMQMEVNYNIGRAMHQVGLLDTASGLYERVLKCGDKFVDGEEVPAWSDLRRDAAYNLIQICRNAGAHQRASKLCRDFLTF